MCRYRGNIHISGPLQGSWLTQHMADLTPGPSCSKLTMSLVNDSLKFTSSDTLIWLKFFAEKMWVAFAVQKLLTFFSAKNIRTLYIESAKTVNEMTLNELVKLMTLWTTGPRSPGMSIMRVNSRELPSYERHIILQIYAGCSESSLDKLLLI